MIACSAFSPGCVVQYGLHDPVIIEFQHRPIKDESQCGNQLRPYSRKQNAGHDNDQGVEEIQRAVPASGLMHHQADHDQVGQNLQRGLQAMFIPKRQQQRVEDGECKPQNHGADEQTQGQRSWGEMRDGQLDSKQEGKDQDPYFDQPGQPISLIKRRLHCESQ